MFWLSTIIFYPIQGLRLARWNKHRTIAAAKRCFDLYDFSPLRPFIQWHKRYFCSITILLHPVIIVRLGGQVKTSKYCFWLTQRLFHKLEFVYAMTTSRHITLWHECYSQRLWSYLMRALCWDYSTIFRHTCLVGMPSRLKNNRGRRCNKGYRTQISIISHS